MSGDYISSSNLHVAIIMDGNGRWAKEKGLLRGQGHHQGVIALRRTIEAAPELGISHLTVFAFSTENWRRPAKEVSDLMGLMRAFIKSDLDRLHKSGVRIRIIGNRDDLPADIVEMVYEAEKRTLSNTRFNLQIALNYGAHSDIIQAVKLIYQSIADGSLCADDISDAHLESSLSTHNLPPLELLIRTSGEFRLSNFLLWEAAYAELVFQDILWPDYGKDALADALSIFKKRQRRFGGLSVDHAHLKESGLG